MTNYFLDNIYDHRQRIKISKYNLHTKYKYSFVFVVLLEFLYLYS